MFFCIQNFILNSLHFQIASKWNYRLHSVLRCKFDYTFTGVSLCSYQVSRWIIFFRLGALVILCTSVPGLSLCCGIPRASTMTVSGLDSACVRLFLVFFGGGVSVARPCFSSRRLQLFLDCPYSSRPSLVCGIVVAFYETPYKAFHVCACSTLGCCFFVYIVWCVLGCSGWLWGF